MRTRLLALAALLVAPVALAAAPSQAAPPADGERAVCAKASQGYANCLAHVKTRGAGPLATADYAGGYSPAQLQKAYGVAGLSGSTLVAVVDAYAHKPAAEDLAVYRTKFGLGTANLKQVNQAGGSITTVAADAGWGTEEMLDLEMVSAMCPTCPILYVGANSASFTDLGEAVNRAALLGAKVISNSYGATEYNGSAALMSTYYTHPGVVQTVSSGDSGYGVQVPAAFSTVVAVGGTKLSLDSTGKRLSEVAWTGAGSGCSAYITKPVWQKDTGCGKRTVSDVSAVADPATGVAVYTTSGSTGGLNWYVYGGTSVAAPIIGGIYGLTGATGTSARLYGGGLNDITSGSNGRCVRGKSGAYLCTAGTGYDGPTGNGTPKGIAAFS